MQFVIEKFRGTIKPLVTHDNPSHPLNSNSRLLEIEAACKNYVEYGSRVIQTMHPQLHEDGTPKHPSDIGNRKWKRKLKVNADGEHVRASDKDQAENEKMVKSGQTYLYRPEGRATVKMICSKFRINRRQFYRWKDTLAGSDVKRLKIALAGKPARWAPQAGSSGKKIPIRSSEY